MQVGPEFTLYSLPFHGGHHPVADDKRQEFVLEDEVPNPANPPKGCNLITRVRL